MVYTFKGGFHVKEHKNTETSKTEVMQAPETVVLPMSQHIGVHCTPIVKRGDHVYLGQLVGVVEKGLGTPVHSSVSGYVEDVVPRKNTQGQPVMHVVVKNDGKDEIDPNIKPADKPLSEYSTEEIVNIIREAGVAGMGGASFPTYAKVSSAIGKVDRMFINCSECEPYITANHRLLLERPEEVVNGAKILLRAFSLKLAEFVIEDNKMNAVASVKKAAAGSELVKVRVVKTKYPQGDERQLIYAVSGREVPTGKLPADVGCVVFNCETCAAVYRAFALGMPVTERIVTVDGDCIKAPKNLLVRLGTPMSALAEHLGGYARTPQKVISGGPMMGIAQWDIDAPVTKGTSAVLFFSEKLDSEKHSQDASCIHCGRCVNACPMHLMPSLVAQYAMKMDYEMSSKQGAMSCVECGTCSYVCPAKMPLVQYIRTAKFYIRNTFVKK